MNTDILQNWIGKHELRTAVASAATLDGLAATLDHSTTAHAAGEEVPPLWHWTYFLPTPRQSELGTDGHPLKGGFLPPIELPRRMWAGSQLEFLRPLKVGSAIQRDSSIADVSAKTGRTGTLVFVKLRHEISDESGLALVEQQDLVYREAAAPGSAMAAPMQAPVNADWRRCVQPTPALLFRYSALTFNTHRIHYDRPYACDQEGYAGLVVHGPLIATLLLDLLRSELPGSRVKRFAFRAVRPLVDIESFEVAGARKPDGTVQLWASDSQGLLATTASAELD